MQRWIFALCLASVAVPALAQDTRDADYYARINRNQALKEETALDRRLMNEIERDWDAAVDKYHVEMAKLGGDDPRRKAWDRWINDEDRRQQRAVIAEQRRHEQVVREIEQSYADQASDRKNRARRPAPKPEPYEEPPGDRRVETTWQETPGERPGDRRTETTWRETGPLYRWWDRAKRHYAPAIGKLKTAAQDEVKNRRKRKR